MPEWRINAVLALAARGLLLLVGYNLVYVGVNQFGHSRLDQQTTDTFHAMRHVGLVAVPPTGGKPALTGKGLDMLSRTFTAGQLAQLGDISTLSEMV